MKFHCISDLHGDISGLNCENCDAVLIAGDFAKLNRLDKWGIYDQKKWIEKKFIPYCQKFPKVKFIVVPGNHDMALDISITSRFSDLTWKLNWPENVFVLIDSEIDIDGIRIYGSPWVPVISHSWAFEADHDKLNEKFLKIPENIDILITHAPPRIPDYAGDISLAYGVDSRKFGSHELAEAVYVKKPKYLLCGHIHSGDHRDFLFENTIISNVSYVDESYMPFYSPKILEI